nr:6890_t:CDS:2 [Entrophospora candida]
MVHQRNGHHNGDSYYKDKDGNCEYNRHDNSYSAPHQRSSPKNSSSNKESTEEKVKMVVRLIIGKSIGLNPNNQK